MRVTLQDWLHDRGGRSQVTDGAYFLFLPRAGIGAPRTVKAGGMRLNGGDSLDQVCVQHRTWVKGG